MPITEEEVVAAQQQWGDGIVAIGEAYSENADYEAVAKSLIDTLYAYDQGPVLFKPTLAAEQQFRLGVNEALSYFVATNDVCPEDKGFAIRPWTAVRFENAGIITGESTALAMGNYYFTDTQNDVTKVEYTFGYIKNADGKLSINLHHSSVPYSP